MIITGNTFHGAAIAAAIPRRFNPVCDPVISNMTPEGKLLGGVIYDGYTENCIFMHQAGFHPSWMTRELLWAVFHYPFVQLGCGKVCGTIPSAKTELLEFNERLGFKVETKITDAYPDGDMLILSMARDECRWLKVTPRGIRSRGGENS
jgi:hypothetical protein